MARKPKLDTILVDAVDVARNALTEIAVDTEIGEYLGATSEGERLVTHRFVSQKKGYRGWTWFATLARVPRAKAKDLTVCEAGIVAGEDALAPAWLPWADRLAKEEIEAAEADSATDESGQGSLDGQPSASTKRIRQLPTNQSRAVSRNQLTVLRSKSRLRLLKQMLWRASRHLRDVRSVDVVQHSALLLVAAQRSAVVHVKTTWTEQNRGITYRSADESLKDSSADRCANCVVRAVRRRSRCSAARRQHRLGRSPQM